MRRMDETTPERVLLEKEKLRRLGDAIALLSESERECLLLRAGRLALSRDRRGAGHRDFHGGRYCGAGSTEISGEMQCVNIREN